MLLQKRKTEQGDVEIQDSIELPLVALAGLFSLIFAYLDVIF